MSGAGSAGTAGDHFRHGRGRQGSGELRRIEWQHPALEMVSETACRFHERELLVALSTLAVGGASSVEQERDACDRCLHQGVRPNRWLPERAP